MNHCKYFKIAIFHFEFILFTFSNFFGLITNLRVIIVPSLPRDTCSVYPTLSPHSTQSSPQLRPNEGGRRHQAVCGADSPESGGEGSQAHL